MSEFGWTEKFHYCKGLVKVEHDEKIQTWTLNFLTGKPLVIREYNGRFSLTFGDGEDKTLPEHRQDYEQTCWRLEGIIRDAYWDFLHRGD